MANKLRVSKSGSGAPTSVTPDFLGQIYINEDTGTRYEATALTKGSWVDKLSLKEDTANKKTTITDNDTDYPTGKAVKTALNAKQDTLTFGIANTNAVKVDDVSVADNDYAKFTANGIEGVPYSTVLSDIGAQAALGYTAENSANKKTDLSGNSDTYYPTQKAVKTAVDLKQDALGYTAENTANKKTSLTDNSDTYYPTQKAVKTAVDAKLNSADKASASDINTGTDETKYITPDALAGSNAFTKTVQQYCVEWGTELAVEDGVGYIVIPAECNGMNLISARADVITAGTTNASTFDIYNVTYDDGGFGDGVSMLSSAISIASGATSGTGTVDTAHDDVATGDLIRIDCKTLSTTKPKGLIITLAFRL